MPSGQHIQLQRLTLTGPAEAHMRSTDKNEVVGLLADSVNTSSSHGRSDSGHGQLQSNKPELYGAEQESMDPSCIPVDLPVDMEAALGVDSFEVDEGQVTRKLHMHLLSRFFVLTLFNYLDRTNLSFAALQMNESLGITDEVYGLGSGVFYIGYLVSQVPSNMILERVGAPEWLSVIVMAWGLVATCFAGMTSIWQFYVLRVLLGIAEGGTFPGMWYHLTLFYTDIELGAAWSVVLLGIAVSQIVGAPMAAGLLAMNDFLGLEGWQWLFIVEGIPTIFLGLWLRYSLAKSPMHCSFLTLQQRDWLVDRVAQERKRKEELGARSVAWDSVKDYRTWWLTCTGALYASAKYGVMYWCPLIVKSVLDAGHEQTANWLVALITTLPFAFASLAMLLNTWHSKLTGEVRYHGTIPILATGIVFAVLPLLMNVGKVPAMMGLMGTTAMYSTEPIWMSWPARFLQGKAAATGVAVINSIANMGGLFGPTLIGYIKTHTTSGGGYAGSMIAMAVLVLLVFVGIFLFPLPKLSSDAPLSHDFQALHLETPDASDDEDGTMGLQELKPAGTNTSQSVLGDEEDGSVEDETNPLIDNSRR